MLTKAKVEEILKSCGALWEGHFLFTSGLHGDKYIQCAKVSQYPKYNELFCRELASRFDAGTIDVVLGPAVGGILIAYEMARQLDARAIFTERVDGKMKLRRGMCIEEGENVLIVEDVITTGGTVKELIPIVQESKGNVVGIAAFVNRNKDRVKFDYPVEVLYEGVLEDYKPEDCPLCKKGIPLVKPGSRK
ncbi:MAG TPA: orotate phosphoribosyltransferase [Peptococcaceae bacterium]|nr:MAG: Orotate phosphoribosyltransferase [Clostridia bacterium 41_269]HBT19903.1 orotate phosphoribosyltransferase [Peptococcaceae bacterium]